MRNLKTLAATTGLIALSAVNAAAQYSTTGSQNFSALLGDSTAGVESGIFEYQAVVTAAGAVLVAVALAWAGAKLVRRLMKGTASA